MALTRSIGAYDDGTVLVPGVGTTPLDTRKSLSALWASAGVVAGGPSPLVTGTAGFAYSVAGPVPLVTTRGPSDGFHMFTNDGAASVTCTGAPGSGLQRIDIVWVRHPTNTENSDTSSAPIFGVASGTAVSSSPAAPSIPTGALELARNTMTSAATSTASAGNAIAQSAATAALRGVPTVPLTVETIGALRYGTLPARYRIVHLAGSHTSNILGGSGELDIAFGQSFAAWTGLVANVVYSGLQGMSVRVSDTSNTSSTARITIERDGTFNGVGNPVTVSFQVVGFVAI